VVAAHLAGSLATLGRDAIIVDLDLDHADQTSILGAEPEHKTVGDLIRVSEELSRQTVVSVLWRHPLGFHAVFAPGRIGDTASAGASRINKVLGTIREATEHVIVDLPSGLNPVSTASLLDASSVEVVLTPDLLGLRRTRDLLKNLDSLGLQRDRINVVLNQAGGPDITEKEVEAVLGVTKVVRLRADLRIYRAANRGELSPLACKLLTPLARRLVAEHSGFVRPAPAAQPEPSAEAMANAASVPIASIEARPQPKIREVRPVGARPAGGRPPARAQEPVGPRGTPAPAPNPSNPLQVRRVWRSGAGTR
jgi:MinD-like ATPase involved in chromosome partitioning or flagellar assembly